jgi:hypothetical protein
MKNASMAQLPVIAISKTTRMRTKIALLLNKHMALVGITKVIWRSEMSILIFMWFNNHPELLSVVQ